MKSLIVKVVVGLVLFAGSLVGALAATGRLNHEGTAGIPLLASFFPAPPKPEGTKGDGAQPVDASHSGAAEPRDASQGAADEPPGPQEPGDGAPRKAKIGRSLVEPEAKPGAHGGGGEGDAPGAARETEDKTAADKAPAAAVEAAAGDSLPSIDFQRLAQALDNGRVQYKPGEYFKFNGMPAGLTAEQINEAWQRVQGALAEIERRKTALALREQELQELADDVARRQHELGRERTEIENEHQRLDARIQKFQEQVKLVRSDEAVALKRNALTLASFEPEKAAELVLEQWKTERGQDEVLRLLEFMDKDAVNEMLKVMPTATVQDLMKKRLRVVKEATPSK
ncbi:MAG TPA: hypothetical protein VFZ65_19745 [Planctomycetota bacterium]|nr:hypothetical protein [Planctomycetota bacterium]